VFALFASLLLPPLGLLVFIGGVVSSDEGRRRRAAHHLIVALVGMIPWLCLGIAGPWGQW
jgi:hypothetical protein